MTDMSWIRLAGTASRQRTGTAFRGSTTASRERIGVTGKFSAQLSNYSPK
jgi:hypothetical protein